MKVVGSHGMTSINDRKKTFLGFRWGWNFTPVNKWSYGFSLRKKLVTWVFWPKGRFEDTSWPMTDWQAVCDGNNFTQLHLFSGHLPSMNSLGQNFCSQWVWVSVGELTNIRSHIAMRCGVSDGCSLGKRPLKKNVFFPFWTLGSDGNLTHLNKRHTACTLRYAANETYLKYAKRSNGILHAPSKGWIGRRTQQIMRSHSFRGFSKEAKTFSRTFSGTLLEGGHFSLSNEKPSQTFHYTGCFLGILIMVYYNHHLTV